MISPSKISQRVSISDESIGTISTWLDELKEVISGLTDNINCEGVIETINDLKTRIQKKEQSRVRGCSFYISIYGI